MENKEWSPTLRERIVRIVSADWERNTMSLSDGYFSIKGLFAERAVPDKDRKTIQKNLNLKFLILHRFGLRFDAASNEIYLFVSHCELSRRIRMKQSGRYQYAVPINKYSPKAWIESVHQKGANHFFDDEAMENEPANNNKAISSGDGQTADDGHSEEDDVDLVQCPLEREHGHKHKEKENENEFDRRCGDKADGCLEDEHKENALDVDGEVDGDEYGDSVQIQPQKDGDDADTENVHKKESDPQLDHDINAESVDSLEVYAAEGLLEDLEDKEERQCSVLTPIRSETEDLQETDGDSGFDSEASDIDRLDERGNRGNSKKRKRRPSRSDGQCKRARLY